MEIWIVGGVMVAIMFYVSSRIRKTTANAYTRETIETNDFSVIKPDGFLNVVSPRDGFALYAYTKDYGAEEAEDIRQAEIFINIFHGKTLDQVRQEIKNENTDIKYEELSDDENSYLLKTERMLEETVITDNFKLFEINGKVYRIKFTVLKDFADEYAERIKTVFDSFRVK